MSLFQGQRDTSYFSMVECIRALMACELYTELLHLSIHIDMPYK